MPSGPSSQRHFRILGAGVPGPEPMEVDAPDPLGMVQSMQRPVYYISDVLHDAKTRYLEMHKLLYAALITSRKLHHYF
jgi:hypothetical protein